MEVQPPSPRRRPSGFQQFCSRSAFSFAPLMICGLLDCKSVETDAQASASSPEPAYTYREARAPPAARADSSYSIGYVGGCPEWMVRVGNDYCIDRFEAHVAVLEGGREKPHPPSVHPKPGLRLIAESSPDSFPQSSINRPEAEEACRNAGKRLCTLAEWKRACMGVGVTAYPYGNVEAKGVCNTGKPHLLSEFFGTDPMKWSHDDMNDPVLNVVKGFLAKPGAYAGCVSSYGAFDMVGNLHEWVSDLVDDRILSSMVYIGKGKRGKHYPKAALGNGIFMGGFFSSENQNGRGCNYQTIAHAPEHYDYSTGFRCCKDAEAD
jgi:sulfatase modifying factor 1